MVGTVILHACHLNENWKLVGIYFKNLADEQIAVSIPFMVLTLLPFKGVFQKVSFNLHTMVYISLKPYPCQLPLYLPGTAVTSVNLYKFCPSLNFT